MRNISIPDSVVHDINHGVDEFIAAITQPGPGVVLFFLCLTVAALAIAYLMNQPRSTVTTADVVTHPEVLARHDAASATRDRVVHASMRSISLHRPSDRRVS